MSIAVRDKSVHILKPYHISFSFFLLTFIEVCNTANPFIYFVCGFPVWDCVARFKSLAVAVCLLVYQSCNPLMWAGAVLKLNQTWLFLHPPFRSAK
jgi:hypothetical protein